MTSAVKYLLVDGSVDQGKRGNRWRIQMARYAVENLRPGIGSASHNRGGREAEADLEREGVQRGNFAQRDLRRCGVDGSVQFFNGVGADHG
jgi:hypothetical protein